MSLTGREVHVSVKIERMNNKELLPSDSCSLTHIMSIQIYFTSFCCHSLCIDSRDQKTATEAASLISVCTMLQECPAWTASNSCFEWLLCILRAVAQLFVLCTVFSWETVWRQVKRNFINPEIQAVSEDSGSSEGSSKLHSSETLIPVCLMQHTENTTSKAPNQLH